MTDLDRLIADASIGVWDSNLWYWQTPKNKSGRHSRRMEIYANRAFNGSLDAALALLNALLPGWHVSEISEAPDPNEYPGLHWSVIIASRQGSAMIEACSPNPARALLLATLKGYHPHRATNTGATE